MDVSLTRGSDRDGDESLSLVAEVLHCTFVESEIIAMQVHERDRVADVIDWSN